MKNAHEYFDKGKRIQGYLELISGYVAVIPLYGTIVSIGIDILNFCVDLALQYEDDWNIHKINSIYQYNLVRMEKNNQIYNKMNN